MVLPPTRLACLTASDPHLFSRQHQVDGVERPRYTMWCPPQVWQRNSPCEKLFPSRQYYNAPAPAARPGRPRLARLLCRLRRTQERCIIVAHPLDTRPLFLPGNSEPAFSFSLRRLQEQSSSGPPRPWTRLTTLTFLGL